MTEYKGAKIHNSKSESGVITTDFEFYYIKPLTNLMLSKTDLMRSKKDE